MDNERRPHGHAVGDLDDDQAAVTEGILGGGHYDSEPSPADAERRSPVGASRPRGGIDRRGRRGSPSGQHP